MSERTEKLFEPFKRRLAAERAVGSLLIAAAAGGAACVVAFLLSLVLPFKLGYGLCALAALGVFAVCFGVIFFARRPGAREIAKRIDETGTGNRAEAAVELEGDDSPMAALQRADAERVIGSLPPSAVRIRVSRIRIIAACVAIAVALGCAFLPNPNITRIEAAEEKREADEKKIDELVDKLEKKVEEAKLPPEAERRAKDVLSELKEKLKKEEGISDRMSLVNEASDKLQEIFDEVEK